MRKINPKITTYQFPNYKDEYLPPNDPDLEMTVIGALIYDPQKSVEMLPLLKPDIFYKEGNGKICQAIINLSDKSIPVDVVSVMQELMTMNELETVGGAHYLATCMSKISSTANTAYHYRYLMEKYFRRELIKIGYQLVDRAYDLSKDVFETYEWIIGSVDELDMMANVGKFMSIDQAVDKLNKMITNVDEESENKTFYSVNDYGLDNLLLLSPSNLVNLSGKSGSGKTTYMIYIARQLMLMYPNVSFCWYTMEDEATKIISALISPDVKLSYDEIHQKNYKLSNQEIKQINELSNYFKKFDIEFVETKSSSQQIKLHFQRFCSKRPKRFNVLIIDNVMLLTDNESFRFVGKSYEVDDHIANNIQTAFTSTKNDYDVIVFYLHHLTKEQLSKANFNEGYRPKEENIRGSTRLRDIATQGLLIHRPGEFKDVERNYKKTEYEHAIKNLMIAEIFKNRNGNLGFMRYFLDMKYKIFYSIPNK